MVISGKKFKIFIIGLPGVGKSTAARFMLDYLNSKLPRTKIEYFDEYDALIRLSQDKNEKRITINTNGQFTINEEYRSDVLVDSMKFIQRQIESSTAEICVVEFSRSNYVNSLREVLEQSNNYSIIYIKADSIAERKRRNSSRSPDHPIKSIPNELMDLPSLSGDDYEFFKNEHTGRVFELNTLDMTLSRMQDEVCLIAHQILDPHFKFRSTTPAWQELILCIVVLMQSVVPLLLILTVWAFPQLTLSKSAIEIFNVSSFRSIIYVSCAGALGATAYSIRCIGRYSIKKMLDIDSYKWWYLLRPIEGALLAIGVYAILRGGVAAIGANFSNNSESANYAFFGLGFLIGIATEAFMEWLIALAKKLTDYRVQPPKNRDEKKDS